MKREWPTWHAKTVALGVVDIYFISFAVAHDWGMFAEGYRQFFEGLTFLVAASTYYTAASAAWWMGRRSSNLMSHGEGVLRVALMLAASYGAYRGLIPAYEIEVSRLFVTLAAIAVPLVYLGNRFVQSRGEATANTTQMEGA